MFIHFLFFRGTIVQTSYDQFLDGNVYCCNTQCNLLFPRHYKTIILQIQIDVFLLYSSPEPFNPDIVQKTIHPIHTDLYAISIEDIHVLLVYQHTWSEFNISGAP
jgi:hypothetical protein